MNFAAHPEVAASNIATCMSPKTRAEASSDDEEANSVKFCWISVMAMLEKEPGTPEVPAAWVVCVVRGGRMWKRAEVKQDRRQ